ncbi:hypothetical protein AAHH80_39860, partial [Burkholderia pseudomallei]
MRRLRRPLAIRLVFRPMRRGWRVAVAPRDRQSRQLGGGSRISRRQCGIRMGVPQAAELDH